MKLLLSSNFPMKGNGEIADVIFQETKAQPRLLFVAYSEGAQKYIPLIKEYGISQVDFLNLKKEPHREMTDIYDLWFFHGGNPFTITKLLEESAMDSRIKKSSALIVTCSGSSCALSRNFQLISRFYPKWEGENTRGLGCFPGEILPHSHRYRKHLQEIEAYGQSTELYALPDGSGIFYEGKGCQLIGAVQAYSYPRP